MSDGLHVEGLTEVVRALHDAASELGALEDEEAAVARQGATLASGYAPRRTAALANSVRASGPFVEITANHAGPVNSGVPIRNQRATHFIDRTAEDLLPIALKRLEGTVNEITRKFT